MKLLFIRHGDPDYANDTLTEKGRREAQLLANFIERLHIDDIYQSPLGRARATAEYSLDKLGKKAITFDWLREFPAEFDPNLSGDTREAFATELVRKEDGSYARRIVWDILPAYLGQHPELLDKDTWRDSDFVRDSDMLVKYDYVISSFDKFLDDNGYKRDGYIYKTDNSNGKTIAMFCHFGITAVLLSHLWNVSPFVPLQFMASAPTSVTEVVTEERQQGIVSFRTLRFGDISHLYIGEEAPSFSARFCERFENEDERH